MRIAINEVLSTILLEGIWIRKYYALSGEQMRSERSDSAFNSQLN